MDHRIVALGANIAVAMAAAVAAPLYTRGGADGPDDRGGSMVRRFSYGSCLRSQATSMPCSKHLCEPTAIEDRVHHSISPSHPTACRAYTQMLISPWRHNAMCRSRSTERSCRRRRRRRRCVLCELLRPYSDPRCAPCHCPAILLLSDSTPQHMHFDCNNMLLLAQFLLL